MAQGGWLWACRVMARRLVEAIAWVARPVAARPSDPPGGGGGAEAEHAGQDPGREFSGKLVERRQAHWDRFDAQLRLHAPIPQATPGRPLGAVDVCQAADAAGQVGA
jgi:hypothetical protein